MSFDSVPPKVEVMGWNARSLADYMKRLKLSGCDKVVIKRSITGAQFMQMTECELQLFPCLHIPIISKIHSEINRGEERRGFGQRSKASKYPKQDFVQEEAVWESDEFDKESDDDGGEYEDEENSYICALSESPQPGQTESEEANAMSDYEPVASPDTKEQPLRPRLTKPLGDDSFCAPTPPDRTPRPPLHHKRSPQTQADKLTHLTPPKMDSAPQKPPKPGRCKPLQLKAPTRPDNCNRTRKLSPPPTPSLQPTKVHSLVPGRTKGMDPRWYAGQVTRHQGEVVLRQVNKDGAFVVRDSSKGLSEQPYTLMVLSQGKVYNIQIRNQGNSYSLGSGHRKTESFPGVKEMISHHTCIPLLLIDATDRSAGAQSQCCLLHPAGF